MSDTEVRRAASSTLKGSSSGEGSGEESAPVTAPDRGGPPLRVLPPEGQLLGEGISRSPGSSSGEGISRSPLWGPRSSEVLRSVVLVVLVVHACPGIEPAPPTHRGAPCSEVCCLGIRYACLVNTYFKRGLAFLAPKRFNVCVGFEPGTFRSEERLPPKCTVGVSGMLPWLRESSRRAWRS